MTREYAIYLIKVFVVITLFSLSCIIGGSFLEKVSKTGGGALIFIGVVVFAVGFMAILKSGDEEDKEEGEDESKDSIDKSDIGKDW